MISVIVPVYNVEKYLNQCVDSILAQTYKDFELILVDDGSPDNCPKICDEYAEKDDRVKVIHKANGGLSDARNVGTKKALGKYITYIDSDDYVSKDYLETLWRLKEKYDADISVTGICRFYEGEEPRKNCKVEEYCYTGIEALENMFYQNTIDSSACAMMIPKNIAMNHPFPLHRYHEDEFTTYKYYIEAESIAVSTKLQYFYLQRKGSIMHTFGQASLDELDAADNYMEFCRYNYPQMLPAAKSKKFSDYCQVLLSSDCLADTNPEVYRRIITFLDAERVNIKNDKKCRTKNRFAAAVLWGGVKPLYIISKIKNMKNWLL